MATVLSISSTVTSGHVGNSAVVFALERLGHEVWPATTISLPHHPGHGPVAGPAQLVTPPESLAATLDILDARGWSAEIDAVAIGYMANADQARVVARWTAAARRARPGILVMVDPILGDGTTLYVAEPVAAAARELLLPLADILKPNLFELGWLAGAPVRSEGEALAAARRFGLAEVVVTSAPAPPGRVANLAVTAGGAFAADTERLVSVPKGTGDLLGALYLAARLDGAAPENALRRATSGVFACLGETQRRGARELALSAAQDLIAAPPPIEVRAVRD